MSTDTATLWSTLKCPQVRNLAWCIFSPSLVARKGITQGATASTRLHFGIHEPQCTGEDWAWLLQLDASPGLLRDWMARCHSTRLGFQFEFYWQFWWQHRHPQLEYRFNVQLTDNGKTLGELDALSWDEGTSQLTHTELAVKFYLGVDNTALPADFRTKTASSWVGPNVMDRLDLKWQQLNQRQLQHLHHHHHHGLTGFRTELPEHWQYERLQTRLIMRGRLFYPLGVQPDWAEAPYVNPHHLHGIWLTLSQFLAPDEAGLFTHIPSTRWMILRRDQWFAPQLCHGADSADHQSVARKLIEHFSQHRQPVQVAAVSPPNAAAQGAWQECQRFFIVPDQWPLMT